MSVFYLIGVSHVLSNPAVHTQTFCILDVEVSSLFACDLCAGQSIVHSHRFWAILAVELVTPRSYVGDETAKYMS